MDRPIPQIPPVECLNLQGVDYFVPWRELPLGASVFIPTVVGGRELVQALKPIQKNYAIRLAIRQRREFDCLGFRVWRVA